MKRGGSLSKLYLVLVFLFLYVPIFCVVIYSFNVSRTSAVWGGFTLSWYGVMAADRKLLDALGNSLIVAGASAALSAVLGGLAAVGAEKLRQKLKAATSGLIFLPLLVPEIILGVSLMMFFSLSPLSYGLTTLILAHTTFCIPYVFLMVQIRLKTIDPAIVEAARDLGAKRATAFFTVVLPLILPAILSGTLLSVAMSLDDVVISSFVSGPTSTTLPIRVFSMLKLGVTPEINALCTLMLVFTFMVVAITRNAGALITGE